MRLLVVLLALSLCPLTAMAARSTLDARFELLTREAGLRWLEGPPAGARRHRVGRLVFERTRRAVWIEDGAHGFGMEAPMLPAGARLLPVMEAYWLDGEDLEAGPSAVALVVAGTDWAWIDGRLLPLERAGATLGDREARAATTILRARRTCATTPGPCLVYGPPAEVLAAHEPLALSDGWSLERVAPPALPATTPTLRRVLERGRVAVESARYAPTTVEDDWSSHASPHRVWLVVGRRRVHAFDVAFFPALDGNHGLLRHGGELLVFAGDGSTMAVSRHDAATGERLAAPLVVRSTPYFHVCDDANLLVPVTTDDGPVFALVHLDDPGRAIVFPGPGAPGRPMRVHGGDQATSAYTVRGRRLVPIAAR